MPYLSEEISIEEIQKWDKQNVVLDYQTGKGKSQFILNVLAPFCKKNGKSILYLVNRIVLRHQLEEDYRKAGIHLFSYQFIENQIKTALIYTEKYDFIICDEAHYFFLDSSFNDTTFLSFDWVMEQTESTKIFMSATCDTLLSYLDKEHFQYLPYQGERDYSYIEDLTFFQGTNDIEIIINQIPSEDKIIVFTTSKQSKKLQEQYKDTSTFLCSKSNSEYEPSMQAIQQQLEEDEKFEEHILFTTIVIDNGINIVDGKVKHIIIDVFNLDTIIQCIGRKRIEGNEKIHIYINNQTYQYKSWMSELAKQYQAATVLLKQGEAAFIEQHFYDFPQYSSLLYLNYKHNGEYTFIVNKNKYHSYEQQLGYINHLQSSGNPHEYMDKICNTLQIVPHFLYWEETKLRLQKFLEYYAQSMTFKQKQMAVRRGEHIVEKKILIGDDIKAFNQQFNEIILPMKLDKYKCQRIDGIDLMNRIILYFKLGFKINEHRPNRVVRETHLSVGNYRYRGKEITYIPIFRY